ncbi:MAG: hypothetical protein ROO76_20410 [Terriglobia bacterium]|nr:hypothetical protein [Terriglobia bacterium]
MRRLPFALAVLTFFSFSALAQTIYQEKQTPPILLGTSGGNVNDASKAFCCSGTLGSLVSKNGIDYILSNNHVLARTGQAAVGEDISQPGLVDTSCRYTNSNIVADYTTGPPLGTQNVDAALAQVRSGQVASDGEILTVGVPSSTPAAPAVGLGVAKAGRTTGLTCGTIGSIDTDVSVRYQQGCNQGKKFVISYTNQVVVNSSSFSAGGDSGSLIVASDTTQPVALLFAGSSTTTIGNPIGDVINALGVTFVGSKSRHSVTCPSAGAGTGGQHGQSMGISQSEHARAKIAKDRNAHALFADPAVQGVGIGEDPDNPGLAVLVIYLEQGRAHGAIPAEIDGVKTVKVITDRFRAYGWNEPDTGEQCSKADK